MLQSRAAIYFDEVARRGSIRRAAEHLRIAASAIDRQLIQLEHYLGTPVFERLPRGMRLTAAGELLVDVVRKARREGDRVRVQIRDLNGLRRGLVSIAYAEGAMPILSKIIVDFREQYSGISFALRQSTSEVAASLVQKNECDLALCFNPVDSVQFLIKAELPNRLGVVVRHDHPFADRPEVRIDECTAFPMIVPDASLSLRQVLDRAWSKGVGAPLPSSYETNTLDMIRTLVIAGAGIGFLTRIDVEGVADGDMIRFVPVLEGDNHPSTLALLVRTSRSLSMPASLFVAAASDFLERGGYSAISGAPMSTSEQDAPCPEQPSEYVG